jgi:hypothetical protein
MLLRGSIIDMQKSAEGIVGRHDRRPERVRRRESEISLAEGDADRMAEMPEDHRKAEDGILWNTNGERQTARATKDTISPEAISPDYLHEPPYAERHVRWCERLGP